MKLVTIYKLNEIGILIRNYKLINLTIIAYSAICDPIETNSLIESRKLLDHLYLISSNFFTCS